MSNGSYLLGGYPQGRPTALAAQNHAGQLRQVLQTAFCSPADGMSGDTRENPAVKPPIYGYLRVTEGLEDDGIRQLELGLEKLAEAEAFCLTEICYEYQPGYYGTFYRLTAELKRTQVRHVVVPSLDHLSAHPLLRDQLLMRLDEANVRVWVVEQ